MASRNDKIAAISVIIEQQLEELKEWGSSNDLTPNEKQSLENVFHDLEHADEELGNLYI